MNDKDLVLQMLKKQDQLNTHTNGKNWKALNIPWYRASWIECAEMMNHTQWKWWKKQNESPLDEIRMELIDIWHFEMSDLLSMHSESMSTNIITQQLENFKKAEAAWKENLEDYTLSELIEYHADAVLQSKHHNLHTFFMLAYRLDMNIEQIFKLYIGKNVLNNFRQNHGYKQGTYIKTWNGKEDNTHLLEILENLQIKENENFEDELYKQLALSYNGRTND